MTPAGPAIGTTGAPDDPMKSPQQEDDMAARNTRETIDQLVERLRALVILDEVGSNNPLGRQAADEIQRLSARASLVDLFSEKLERRTLALQSAEAALTRMEGALREMRDVEFGVSGKTGREINKWFNDRAASALSSTGNEKEQSSSVAGALTHVADATATDTPHSAGEE